MKTRIILATVAAFVISIATSFSASAQGWSSVKRFMNTERAAETLAAIAHPTATLLSSSVIASDSNTITVKLTFEGFLLGNYTCKYELEKSAYGDGNFISRVRCTSEGAIAGSFTTWSVVSNISFYSLMYDRMFEDDPAAARKVWGASKFSDLSNSAKAGFVMTIAYADYIN